MTRQNGFTIVEVAVVVVIIAILTALTVTVYNQTQKDSRDNSAKSKVSAIAAALEKYYDTNGEYPTCAQIAAPTASQAVAAGVLQGIDPNALARQNATTGTNSINCTAATTTTFAYSTTGTSYTLSYIEEATGNTATSTRQR